MTPIFIFAATLMMAALLLFQLYPLIASFRSRGKNIPDLQGLVEERVLRNKRYCLYCWSPQCGICPYMTRVIDKLSQERNDIAKMNTDDYSEIARGMGVMGTGIPALVFIENGQITNVSLGAKTEKKILRLLNTPKVLDYLIT